MDEFGQPLEYEPFVATSSLVTSCSSSAQPVAGLAWALTLAVESILFVMVLVKLRRKCFLNRRSSSTQGDLLDVLARDSSVYYGM